MFCGTGTSWFDALEEGTGAGDADLLDLVLACSGKILESLLSFTSCPGPQQIPDVYVTKINLLYLDMERSVQRRMLVLRGSIGHRSLLVFVVSQCDGNFFLFFFYRVLPSFERATFLFSCDYIGALSYPSRLRMPKTYAQLVHEQQNLKSTSGNHSVEVRFTIISGFIGFGFPLTRSYRFLTRFTWFLESLSEFSWGFDQFFAWFHWVLPGFS